MHEAAKHLAASERWTWRDGMSGPGGGRYVNGAWIGDPAEVPDLSDAATVGVLLVMLDETSALRDLVRDSDDWIAAVEIDGDLRGYAADTVGEALAWALLAAWGEIDIAVN